MRYFLSVFIFVVSVSLTKESIDAICLEETDAEICESFHIQCGVTIHMTNYCGKNREVNCECPVGESCSMGNLTCQ